MPQLLVVVLKEPGKSQRDRQQSGTLRLGIKSIGIGAANYAREFGQRRISQLILVKKCVEAAARADVG